MGGGEGGEDEGLLVGAVEVVSQRVVDVEGTVAVDVVAFSVVLVVDVEGISVVAMVVVVVVGDVVVVCKRSPQTLWNHSYE